jgi:hypothetical protein
MNPNSLRNHAAADNTIDSVGGADLRPPVSLVVAHPGPELLAFGWLARLKPAVSVVTDGSGRGAGARIAASAKFLDVQMGSRGSIFGRWADLELYDALFESRFGSFLELRDELVDAWFIDDVQTVICDAYERRILMHDVVQLTVSAAVDAARERGAAIELVELPIYLGPLDDRPGDPSPAASLTLSDEALKRKIAAARAYESKVLQEEVEGFLRVRSEVGFRSEVLFRSIRRTANDLEEEPQPAWEAHGERLVQQGVYDRVIRLREHVVPLARALALMSRKTE